MDQHPEPMDNFLNPKRWFGLWPCLNVITVDIITIIMHHSLTLPLNNFDFSPSLSLSLFHILSRFHILSFFTHTHSLSSPFFSILQLLLWSLLLVLWIQSGSQGRPQVRPSPKPSQASSVSAEARPIAFRANFNDEGRWMRWKGEENGWVWCQ